MLGVAGADVLEGAYAPHVRAATQFLGVVDRRRVVPAEAAGMPPLDQLHSGKLGRSKIERAVFGETFEVAPIVGSSRRDQLLGDGVLFVTENRCGDPLRKEPKTGFGEDAAEAVEISLPNGEKLFTVIHDASPFVCVRLHIRLFGEAFF
jgi:hypothetical protein